MVTSLAWLVLGCPSARPPAAGAAPPAYDVIVRHGTVFDGEGGPGRAADVGVRGDRIVAVGDLGDARAPLELDATDLAVAPGFINTLSSWPVALLLDPLVDSELRQGVTLEIFGEGALGLGSALIYPPGVFADTDELVALASAAAEYDGIYASHLRSEGPGLLDPPTERDRGRFKAQLAGLESRPTERGGAGVFQVRGSTSCSRSRVVQGSGPRCTT